MIRGGDRRRMRGDALAACALALLMTAAWALRDWPRLAALRLPDTDDAMRLVQIRDWLAGQRFADLSQHRLAGGVPMHWSRLPDLVPGGLIALLTPLLGRHAAEIAAVIAWLCSPEMEPLNGRVIYIAGGHVSLVAEPELIRSRHNARGWDLDSLLSPAVVTQFTYDQRNHFPARNR